MIILEETQTNLRQHAHVQSVAKNVIPDTMTKTPTDKSKTTRNFERSEQNSPVQHSTELPCGLVGRMTSVDFSELSVSFLVVSVSPVAVSVSVAGTVVFSFVVVSLVVVGLSVVFVASVAVVVVVDSVVVVVLC